LVALALGILLGGCTKEGEVRVINATDYPLVVNIMDRPDETIPARGEYVTTVKLSKGIFPPSEREIEIKGRGVVKQPFSQRVVVEEGKETTLEVQPDAAGLVIVNEIECSIREVYIKACGVGQWGANWLSRGVRPLGMTTIRLDAGCFDIRIKSAPCPEDPFGRVYESWSTEIGRADTLHFRWAGGP
jgi:hypothetical protein